ncbi:hypothetical protein GCM10027517_11660 [Phycicoccus ginsengisoli]
MSEQGAVYAAFIDQQLAWERARQSSLDERGSKLQQAASLTAGLYVAALSVLNGKDAPLTGPALAVYVGTIVVLAAAFLFGVITTRLVEYEVADNSTLTAMTEERWGDSAVDSLSITAYLNTKAIASLRAGNNFKANCLHRGILCQGVGVVAGAGTFAVVAAGALT